MLGPKNPYGTLLPHDYLSICESNCSMTSTTKCKVEVPFLNWGYNSNFDIKDVRAIYNPLPQLLNKKMKNGNE